MFRYLPIYILYFYVFARDMNLKLLEDTSREPLKINFEWLTCIGDVYLKQEKIRIRITYNFHYYYYYFISKNKNTHF